MKTVCLFAFLVVAAQGAAMAAQTAFAVRDGIAAYPGTNEKAAPVATLMRNQKVEVLERYKLGRDGDWSKIQISKGKVAYIKTADLSDAPKPLVVTVEVMDSTNLTESIDARGQGVGVIPTIINSTTGRRTHTDNATLAVIINGERALLDCYEQRKGCTPIGAGKYSGELDSDSVWIDYQMPVTHQNTRNHYKIVGGW